LAGVKVTVSIRAQAWNGSRRRAADEGAGYSYAALIGVPWRCALAGIEKMASGVTVRLSIVTVCFLNRTSTPAPQEAMKKQDGQIN
jgi:hypothetical protein